MLKPIRIGDTFSRIYTRYNPLASNPELPDYTSPVNLTGLTAKFVIVQKIAGKNVQTVYQGSKVVITPLLGRTKVDLTPTDTTALKPSYDSDSYLEFTTAAGEVESIIQLRETVKNKWQT